MYMHIVALLGHGFGLGSPQRSKVFLCLFWFLTLAEYILLAHSLIVFSHKDTIHVPPYIFTLPKGFV